MSGEPGYGPLADVVRNGVVESRHSGAVSVVRGGVEVAHSGDTGATMFARSSLKPFQLVAMLDAGLSQGPWSAADLAVMASSHSGQAEHLEQVRSILARVGLSESDLRNTPALPMDPAARQDLREQGVTAKASLFGDCSGKHAAMLATCVVNRWPRDSYLDPAHPLQERIRATIEAYTGDRADHTAVDGCGAPLFSGTTAGLARGLAMLADAEPTSNAARVANAMREHPVLVAGRGRDVTAAMQATPGLLVKDGAEGVLAGALHSADSNPATGFAIKVADGAARPRPVVLAALLQALGVVGSTPAWSQMPVLGGGRVVGQIQSSLTLVWNA
ncbi:MAG: asparaginase [Actinomycetales bacterium]|nr:asparaginase [Actinomycetales bacterium]